jgi:4-amino-4-deoxy-L-arabinose transferase-like glycosyltransferase
MAATGRNAPCPCGSGKKYKHCCVSRPSRKGLYAKNPLKGNAKVFLALSLIFLLSVVLRGYGFSQPHGLTFDEGLYAELLGPQLQKDPTHYSTREAYRALSARGERLPEYLDRPLFKHPPLYPYFIALTYTLFGEGNAAAAAVSILWGCLMVGAVFFLGRTFYDNRVGLLAGLFLAVDPIHWICSEKIWMETTLSFFMITGIFFFALGFKQERYLMLGGLATGLAMVTKYTGVLNIFIIGSFAFLWERRILKRKEWWIGCLVCGVVFMPWVLWNMAVYDNFPAAFMMAHASADYWKALLPKGAMMLGAGLIAAGAVFLASRLKPAGAPTPWTKTLLACGGIAMVLFFPGGRAFVQDVFTWHPSITVGWSNSFAHGPWYFYFQQLVKFSPLYLFSFLSFFLLPSKNKGDLLMVWCCVWILGFHLFWGNYQSRYILPAVPFLLILAARFLIWGCEKKQPHLLRFCLILGGSYFFLKTLKTGLSFAAGPDFGYF